MPAQKNINVTHQHNFNSYWKALYIVTYKGSSTIFLDILHPEEKYVQLIQNVQKRQQIPPSAQEIVVYRGLTEGEPEH